MKYSEYKVIEISEGGCSTLFFGSAPIPTDKLQIEFNRQAKDGWSVVFQLVERRRFLLLWSRESVIVTFGK